MCVFSSIQGPTFNKKGNMTPPKPPRKTLAATFSNLTPPAVVVDSGDSESVPMRVMILHGDSSVCGLGLVDLQFECSTFCPILPGLIEI